MFQLHSAARGTAPSLNKYTELSPRRLLPRRSIRIDRALIARPTTNLSTPLSLHRPSATPPHSAQRSVNPLRSIGLHASKQLGMASDADYMAFLDKANQDVSGAGQATARGGQAQFKAVDAGTRAPEVIEAACKDTFYVSDADEPFVSVSLRWSGEDGLPDEVEFAKLINHWDPEGADISIMDPLDWDSKGEYVKLLEAVREASRGNDVRVYRVVRDSSRVEYWLVTVEEGRIVGAKALGIES